MTDSFYQLNSHFWLQQSRYFSTNCGVFIDQGQAALIDPGIAPDEIEEICGFLSGKKVRADLVLLTHAHWDHILGVGKFPGAKVLAHRNFLEETASEAGERLKLRVERFYQEIGAADQGRVRLPIPDIVFSKAMSITVGNQQLRLFAAPGHSSSHMAIYHAGSRTLWAGDMLSDIEIPLPASSLAEYSKTLDNFSSLDIHFLVPGHGQPVLNQGEASARLDHDQKYTSELEERVRRAIDQAFSLDLAIEVCADMVFHHPDDNADQHRVNVEKAFLELGGSAV